MSSGWTSFSSVLRKAPAAFFKGALLSPRDALARASSWPTRVSHFCEPTLPAPRPASRVPCPPLRGEHLWVFLLPSSPSGQLTHRKRRHTHFLFRPDPRGLGGDPCSLGVPGTSHPHHCCPTPHCPHSQEQACLAYSCFLPRKI